MNEIDHDHSILKQRITYSAGFFLSKKKLEEYNKSDVINCDDLRRELITTRWYINTEQPLSQKLFQAEVRGIQLDIPYLKGLDNEFDEKLKILLKDFGDGFNPASPKQVKEEFKKKGITLESTDKHTLKSLLWNFGPNSFVGNFTKRLLEYRGLSKLSGTYVKPFIEQADNSGRLHGRFNQAGRESGSLGDIKGTATGRLSSSDPNLQNIPDRTVEGRKVRRGIIATPGMILLDSDLKRIEPTLTAHYTQSKVLLNAYEKGLDTHAIMGGLIFNKSPENLTKLERFIGKTSWLATFYGAWYKKLKQIVENNSEEPVYYNEEFYKKIQQAFWQANPELRGWRERHISTVCNTGFVETIGGRIIKISGLNSRNEWERNEAERLAINYLIQGSAADIMKMAIVNLDFGYLLASVHDEILMECDLNTQNPIERLNKAMTSTVKLDNVQIEADTRIINSWADK